MRYLLLLLIHDGISKALKLVFIFFPWDYKFFYIAMSRDHLHCYEQESLVPLPVFYKLTSTLTDL